MTSIDTPSLFEIRSGLAADLACWYEAVIDHFDRTEWRRPEAGSVSLRRISVNARVYREARRRPEREESGSPQQSSRPRVNRELARINEEPLRQSRSELVWWKDEIPSINHAVILGAPGAGKSFLAAAMMIQTAQEELRKLAGRHIDLESAKLPVFLKLEDVANADGDRPCEETAIDLLRRYLVVGRLLADWMKQKLFTEQCLWMLDGLDQVGGEAGVKRVDNWLARIERSECRAVVTCRTQSFSAQRAPGRSFVQYDLAPFEPPEIRRFIEKWYGAGDSRGGHLLSILRTNSSLEDSCRTPLVATLACLVNEDRERPLPQNTRRVDLYEKIIRRFQDEEGRSGLDDIEREAEFLQMQRLAWNLFSARPESNQFSGAEMIAAVPEGDVRQATARLKRLLRCRVLVKSGIGIADASQYSFIHRTVLEFLAAKYLARVVDKQGWERAEVEIAGKCSRVLLATVIAKKSWIPAWSATLVFLSGCLKMDAAPMIDMLWGESVDMGWHLRVLALQCLAALRKEERAEHQEDRITVETHEFLIKLLERNTEHLIAEYKPCLRALAEVNGKVYGKRYLNFLIDGLRARDSVLSRILENIGPALAQHDWILGALVRCIQVDTKDVSSLSISVLKAIGPLVAGNPEALGGLAQRLRAENDPYRRQDLIYALEAIGSAAASHTDVISTLRKLLRDPVPFIRTRAIVALKTMGEAAARDDDVISDLQWIVREDADARTTAIWTLKGLTEWYCEDVAERISSFLATWSEPAAEKTERDRAFEEEGNRRWRAYLDQVSAEGTNPETYDEVAAYLGLTLRYSHFDIPGLLQELRHEDPSRRRSAASSLGTKGADGAAYCSEVVPAVLCSLREDDSADVRAEAADALGKIGEGIAAYNSEVIQALLRSLRQDANPTVRAAAARALGMTRGAVLADLPEIIQSLLCYLPERDDPRVLTEPSSGEQIARAAAGALSEIFSIGVRVFRAPFEITNVQDLSALR